MMGSLYETPGQDQYKTCILATGRTRAEERRSARILAQGHLPIASEKGHSFIYFSKKGFIRTTSNMSKAQRFHPLHAINMARMLNLVGEDAKVSLKWEVWSL
jgi:hypothetical protein